MHNYKLKEIKFNFRRVIKLSYQKIGINTHFHGTAQRNAKDFKLAKVSVTHRGGLWN